MSAPELATDLVDPLDPPDDQLLQVELWRYAHVELHVEVVVVRHKRTGGGTACKFEGGAAASDLPARM